MGSMMLDSSDVAFSDLSDHNHAMCLSMVSPCPCSALPVPRLWQSLVRPPPRHVSFCRFTLCLPLLLHYVQAVASRPSCCRCSASLSPPRAASCWTASTSPSLACRTCAHGSRWCHRCVAGLDTAVGACVGVGVCWGVDVGARVWVCGCGCDCVPTDARNSNH